GKRFYDLNKDPIVSPYTGEVVEIVSGKSRAMTPDAEDAATKKLKTKAKDDESGDVIEDDAVDVELDDDLLEDDDEDTVSLDDIADVESDEDM
ncbi:MAG TPA: primosomal protein, partial [Roseovarius sp.]|nr:primosomal protein [Roseovarius sp.]